MTHSHTLTRNTLFNLIGYGTPLAVALVAIPLLIKGLGTDRFGILTLAWVFIGYLSLLDLGLGRALTKVVAERLGQGDTDDLPAIIWTALFAMTLMGAMLAMVLQPFISPAMRSLLNIPGFLISESISAYRLLAACIPLVIFSVGLRGILEAYQRFDLTNIIRIPLGVYSFCAPLFIMPFTKSLVWVIAVILFGRVIAAVVQFFFCCRVVDQLCHRVCINKKLLPELFKFGGWMSVSNVIVPILVAVDRYFIGAILSVAMVAYYATPSEVVTKLLLISGALMSVLFPAFSATFRSDREQAAKLLKKGVRYTFLMMFPVTLMIVIFAKEILSLWIDPEFAVESFKVMQWLTIGVFILSMSRPPYAFVQGAGRPDLTAKLHLLEVPLYLLFLWLMIRSFGIEGAAYIWCLRMLMDLIGTFWLAQRIVLRKRVMTPRDILMMGGAVILLALATFLGHFLVKLLFAAGLLMIFSFISWRFLLSKDEKNRFLKSICKGPGK